MINDRMDAPIAEAMIGDTTDEAFRRKVFDHMCAKHGAPRICVPAAAVNRDQLAVKLDRSTGEAVMYPVDQFRHLRRGQPDRAGLLGHGDGRPDRRGAAGPTAADSGSRTRGRRAPIIFIGSISSQGIPGQIAYGATKAALEGAARTLSKEAMYFGVRCAVIHPGFTDTQMVRALGEDYIQNNILPYTQLKRLIDPEEIADAIYFMICNSAVSGELWADAGWHPRA